MSKTRKGVLFMGIVLVLAMCAFGMFQISSGITYH